MINTRCKAASTVAFRSPNDTQDDEEDGSQRRRLSQRGLPEARSFRCSVRWWITSWTRCFDKCASDFHHQRKEAPAKLIAMLAQPSNSSWLLLPSRYVSYGCSQGKELYRSVFLP